MRKVLPFVKKICPTSGELAIYEYPALFVPVLTLWSREAQSYLIGLSGLRRRVVDILGAGSVFRVVVDVGAWIENAANPKEKNYF